MPYDRKFPADYVNIFTDPQKRSLHLKDSLYFAEIKKIFHKLSATHKLRDDNLSQYRVSERYPDVHTLRQEGIEYPTAQLPTKDALAEGPCDPELLYHWKNPTYVLNKLLAALQQFKLSVLIPVGQTKEQNKEKFYNYMADKNAKPIFAQAFFAKTVKLPSNLSFPEELNQTNFKFYTYTDKSNNVFYVMHIPNWDDHGFPRFSIVDKTLLAYYFAHGSNACYHCSAGIGRSPALLVAKMAYKQIYSQNKSTQEEIILEIRKILEVIKTIKPLAGELNQLYAALALAEDLYILFEGLKAEVTNDSLSRTNSNSEIGHQHSKTEVTTTTITATQHITPGYAQIPHVLLPLSKSTKPEDTPLQDKEQQLSTPPSPRQLLKSSQ